MTRKFIKWMWITAFGMVAFVILCFVAVAIFTEMPSFEDLENPKNALATEVYGSDGAILGKYFIQNRSYTKYEELSPDLVNALISTEDKRFHKHSGIDLYGTTASFYYLLIGKKRGASTITQQLALNLFSQRSRNIFVRMKQKMQEWIIAIQLERQYTKEEIVAMYFNTVEFGYNAYGIKSAARSYFNTTTDSLKTEEAAMLVGLLKGTYLYSPLKEKNRERATNRRNTVLELMAKNNAISEEQADSLKKLPIKLDLKPQEHSIGLATYFREHLRQELNKWSADPANRKPDGSKYDLYKDGLKVYTTIDTRMQLHAEEAMKAHMAKLQKTFFEHWKGREPWGKEVSILESGKRRSSRYITLKREGFSDAEITENFNTKTDITLFSWDGPIDTVCTPMDSIKYSKKFLQTGFMAMEPSSGHVKSWVGGINIDFSQYDHVNINAKRQAGSTFKPFVYAVAVDNGFPPCNAIPNSPVTFPEFQNWTPSNYDGKNGGSYTMFGGIAKSVNNIVAYLMKQVGPESVIELSNNLGIKSKMDPYPSLCLGSFDMSVYEMVGAYSSFANKGEYVQPIYLLRIEDKNGNIIAQYNPERKKVLSEESAYVMTQLLQGVVRRGTATRIRGTYGLTNAIGGKTGTTQNNSDGWFIGISPEIAAGAWVGADDRAVHFRTTALGGGSNSALPMVGDFLRRVYADKRIGITPKAAFDRPAEGVDIDISCGG